MSFLDSFAVFLSNHFNTLGFVDNFHFIRPAWLLAFFALGLCLYLLKKMHYYQSPWQHFLPPHLTKVLLEQQGNNTTATLNSGEKSHGPTYVKHTILGSCFILALAGPAWQKLPQPVYQLARGSVIIMDMSYSMYATDIKPNRLTRARYKAIDLLQKINEGDMGLIAYAGDAFIISPLTQDRRNIELLMPSLSPDIMPVLGANALSALTLANTTLKNAGHVSGDIYWFTDDIDNEEMSDIYEWSAKFSHNLHILGIGTPTGAPITLTSGELLKSNSGAIVVPKLPADRLRTLAQRGRGNYSTITNNDEDIDYLTATLTQGLTDDINKNSAENSSQATQQKNQIQGDQYQEHGPWLLLIVMPLLLSYFRRGSTLLSVGLFLPLSCLLSVGLTSLSTPTYAADVLQQPVNVAEQEPSNNSLNSTSASSSWWQDIWQTDDQQAEQHFNQENYSQAAQQFKNPQWQASAHYKAGNYQQALAAFQQGDSADALYNQGNSHAQMQQYDEAIEAYKKALVKNPDLQDAQDNIDSIEALQKQQQEQEQSKDGDESQENNDDPQDSQQDQQQTDDGDKKSEESSDSQQEKGQDPQSGDPAEQESETSTAPEATDEQAKAEEEKKKEAQQQAESDAAEQGEKTPAQIASEQKAQEDRQKHQQLLNKVTDDPYLLLRNKMQLEYKKRQQEGRRQGVNKKW